MNEEYNEQQKEVLHLLKVLNDNDVLNHVVLVGSWAEYVYALSGILPGFAASLRTLDVDFLVKNLRRPTAQVDVAALAKEEGYSIGHDTLTGTTKLVSPGGLEVEFLISKKGRGSEQVLQTNLGVVAQTLWHMTAIIDNAITANILGMKVQVPCPEIYALTKMIINEERKPEKQLKDAQSVQRLLPYLDYDRLDTLYAASTKKEKDSIRGFFKKYSQLMLELPLESRMKVSAFISQNMPEGKELASGLSIDDR